MTSENTLIKKFRNQKKYHNLLITPIRQSNKMCLHLKKLKMGKLTQTHSLHSVFRSKMRVPVPLSGIENFIGFLHKIDYKNKSIY